MKLHSLFVAICLGVGATTAIAQSPMEEKDRMSNDPMKKDHMERQRMSKGPVRKDAMGQDAKGRPPMGSDAMGKDPMGTRAPK